MPKKLVFGIGLNDADYFIRPRDGEKQPICQFYLKWYNMMQRCYGNKYQAKYPTYIGCKVCDEWLTFSKFKAWMEKQDWQSKELDKDLLVKGNKVYSPDTCVFVDGATNRFTLDGGATRGEWPLGVCFDKERGRFLSLCNNPFTGKQENLGRFTCQDQAHQAWKKRKHELALQLANLQTDSRVAKSLRSMYL